MDRWIKHSAEFGANPAVDAFLAEVIEVSKRHGLAIEHEDGHGAFQVVKFNEDAVAWISRADDCTGYNGSMRATS